MTPGCRLGPPGTTAMEKGSWYLFTVAACGGKRVTDVRERACRKQKQSNGEQVQPKGSQTEGEEVPDTSCQ